MSIYPSLTDPELPSKLLNFAEFTFLENKEGLYPHQEFIRRYLSIYTPYRDIILFHSVGSGKSMVCISVSVDHFLANGTKTIVLTKGPSCTNNFKKEVQIYLEKNAISVDKDTFNYHHYAAFSNYISTITDEQLLEISSNKIIVMDEIHNIRKNDSGDRKTYSSMKRLYNVSRNSRFILASATPMVNDTSQMEDILELVGRKDLTNIISYNSIVIEKPSIKYVGDLIFGNKVLYPSYMQGIQLEKYVKRATMDKPNSDIYKGLVQTSLFCFPDEGHSKDILENNIESTVIRSSIIDIETKKHKTVNYLSYSVKSQWKDCVLFDGRLRECSSKYYELLKIIRSSTKFPIFVFMEDVKPPGATLLAHILELEGYTLYNGEDLETVEKDKKYTLCVGDFTVCPNQQSRLSGYNSELNKNGDYIQILIGSKIIGESVTLLNTRQFHAITLHWNDSVIDQAIGRVIRSGSHSLLEPEERNVDIYIHVALTSKDDKMSIDMFKATVSNRKQKNITEIEKLMIENSVDRHIGEVRNNIIYDNIIYMPYFKVYINRLIELVTKAISNSLYISYEDLYDITNLEELILNEILFLIVTKNIKINNMYLRECFGGFCLLEEAPNTHYVYPEPKKKEITPIEYREVPDIPGYTMSYRDSIEFIRSIEGVAKKVSLVEECILRNRYDVIQCLYIYIYFHQGTCYHTMKYKEKTKNAYNAMTMKVPSRSDKIRILDGEWKDSPRNDEILLLMKSRYEEIERHMYQFETYGIISIIDNKMRIWQRPIGIRDKRKIYRGRVPRTMKKEYLSKFISTEYDYSQSTIEEMSDIVEGIYINSGKVLIF